MTAKTQKGFYTLLFSIAIPIILQNLLQTFINVMDTIMVGRLGSVEIAAVGLGNQIFFVLNLIVFGLCSGCTVFISQFWGACDIKGIRKTSGLMLIFCFAFSLLFALICIFKPQIVLGLYSKDQKVIAVGCKYLKVVALSYPLMAISFSCQMAFRATEHVVLPMVTTAISFVLNVVFNLLLIFGCEPLHIAPLGVVGAAVATLISRIVEMLVTLIYSKAHHFEAFGTFGELVSFFDRKFLLKIVKIALPVLFSDACWGLGITVQNAIFAHAGTDSFAAYSITNTIKQLTWVFFIGVGDASAIIIGNKIGSEDVKGAIKDANHFCWFVPLTGVIIGLLLFPLSRLLPFVFNVEEHIIKIAQSMLFVLMVMYPFRSFSMLAVVGVCRAGGDTLFASIIDNAWMWFIAIPVGCFAIFVLKVPSWQGMICLEMSQVLTSICGFIRIKSGKWLHNVTK